jgi:hypothetical protein
MSRRLLVHIYFLVCMASFCSITIAQDRILFEKMPISNFGGEAADEGYVLNQETWQFNDTNSFCFSQDTPPQRGWIPLQQAISREYKVQRARHRGGNVWYKISTSSVPKSFDGQDVVLDFENRFAVMGCFHDGRDCPNVSPFNDYSDVTYKYFLIEKFSCGKDIFTKTADFDFRYPNHVGQVVMRPAGTEDFFECQLDERMGEDGVKDTVTVKVTNRTQVKRMVTVEAQVQDFFEKTLRTQTKQTELEPGKTDTLPVLKENLKEYKIAATLIYNDKRSLEYWDYFAYASFYSRENEFRIHQLLNKGWSYHWVSANESFKQNFPDNWLTDLPDISYPAYIKEGTPYIVGADKMKTHKVLFKKNFKLDKNLYKDKRIYLNIHSVNWQADIFVDGKFIESRRDLTLPGKVNLTDFLSGDDEHELKIGVTDYIVCLAPEVTVPSDGNHVGEGYIAPAPPMTREHAIGMIYTPFLTIEPEVTSRDIQIITLCDEKRTIKINCTVENHTDIVASLTAVAQIYYKGNLFKEFPSQKISIPHLNNAVVKWEETFPEAQLWSPESPTLYELRIVLKQNDKIIDVNPERFGVKEYAIKDKNFYLNNKVFQPYGINNAWKGKMPQPIRKTPMLIDRLQPARSIELQTGYIADELGYVSSWWVQDNSDYGWKYHMWWDERLYDNLKKSAVPKIKYFRNMPSIFAWSLGNEVPSSDFKACKKEWDYVQFVNKLDPTRLAYYSDQGSLHGLANINAPHYFMQLGKPIYPTDVLWYSFEPNERPEYVNTRFGLKKVTGGQGYSGDGPRKRATWWDRDVPLFESEGMVITDGRWESLMSGIYGDSVFMRRPEIRGRENLAGVNVLDCFKEMARGVYRQIGMSAMLGQQGLLSGTNPIGDRGAMPLAIFAKDTNSRFWSGKTLQKTLTLFNSCEQDQICKLDYILVADDGTVIQSGYTKESVAIQPGGRIDFTLDISLPTVKTPIYADLYLNVKSQSGKSFRQVYRNTIFPSPEFKNKYQHVAVFDPNNVLFDSLKHIGLDLRHLTGITEEQLKDIHLLIVADNATEQLKDQVALIKDKVNNGLSVFLMKQDVVNTSLIPVHVEDGRDRAFGGWALVSDQAHFLFKNLLYENFYCLQNKTGIGCTFANGCQVSEDPRAKTLMLGGSGQEYSPLTEISYGKGFYYLCQLYLKESLVYDPTSQIFLANLLNHFEDFSFNTSAEKTIVVLEKSNEIQLFLQRAGFSLASNELLDESKLVIVTGGWDAQRSGVGEQLPLWVRNGGCVIFHKPDQQTLTYIKEHFDLFLTDDVNPFTGASIIQESQLLRGLSSLNFQWSDGSGRGRRRAVSATDLDLARNVYKIESLNKSVQAMPLLYPNCLIEANVGKGKIFVESIRWDEVTTEQAKGVICRQLCNLGVAYGKSQSHKGQLFPEYSFKPVSLSKYVNWGLSDSRARDGLGGWTDGGPQMDMREVPMGNQIFRDVPFYIPVSDENNGYSLCTFKGSLLPNMPETGPEIAINSEADAIAFLHSADLEKARWGQQVAEVTIWYRDRQSWIPGAPDPFVKYIIRNGVSICDWKKVGQIRSGQIAIENAAWAWTNKEKNGDRGLVVYLWNNPHPDKIIDAIQISTKSCQGQYFLLGISLGKANR